MPYQIAIAVIALLLGVMIGIGAQQEADRATLQEITEDCGA